MTHDEYVARFIRVIDQYQAGTITFQDLCQHLAYNIAESGVQLRWENWTPAKP